MISEMSGSRMRCSMGLRNGNIVSNCMAFLTTVRWRSGRNTKYSGQGNTASNSRAWLALDSHRHTEVRLRLATVEKACSEFYKVFSMHDGLLFEERYNLLNAFFATIPGNRHFNLRYLWLLNTNYADYSFLFTLHTGERRNKHLNSEYLAVLETNYGTPYFLNLHYQDTAHSIVLGRTGSGKSFFLNFLITNLQKYSPYTFIFDLGGSFRGITQLFGGAYLRVSA